MKNQSLKLKDTEKSDLKVRSYQLALRVIKLVGLLQNDIVCQTIGRQLLRSATSIGANIVEAKGASSKKDFTIFFFHALKSANESIYWLELLKDSEKVKNINLDPLLREVSEIANMLGSSVLTLRGKNK